MPVELTCRAVNGRPYAAQVRADALTLLGILTLEHCELSLMLVADRGIRRLNRDFRGKDQVTDVLSFPQLEADRDLPQRHQPSTPDAPPVALGDIVISVDTARRQARELGQSLDARIRTLLIHGTLHLLGFDHERSLAQARRMFAREHQLVALMNEACARLPRSHRSGALGAAPANRSKKADETVALRWSPAAMPERTAKAKRKKSTGRR